MGPSILIGFSEENYNRHRSFRLPRIAGFFSESPQALYQVTTHGAAHATSLSLQQMQQNAGDYLYSCGERGLVQQNAMIYMYNIY